jgi:hypothetical protein
VRAPFWEMRNRCDFPSGKIARQRRMPPLTSYALDDRLDSFKKNLSAYIGSLESDQDRALARLEQIARLPR